ncbi:MAG TPA: hypothetical protein VII92_00005 [Anaerolineae bacterium]
MGNAHERAAAALDRAVSFLEAKYNQKNIGQIVKQYDDQLTRLVYDTFCTGDAIDMRRAHRAMMKDLGLKAYVEGMREGGIDKPDDDDTATAQDMLDEWRAGQFEHVNQFAKDAAAAKADPTLRAGVLARVPLWVDSLRNFGEMGKLYALGNVMLTFDGDDGEESCIDCQRYKGQRHGRNWWAVRGLLERNGNPNYECGRYGACHHSFYDDKGKVVVS